MSHNLNSAVAVIGIDIGKSSFHVVGHDKRGAIMLRQKHCNREVAIVKRELELTQRELSILREEVGLERGLRDLRAEVAEAREQVPEVPAIAAQLEAEQACLQRELDAIKQKLSKLRVNQSITDYGLSKLRKQVEASGEASIEMEFESRSSHFQMKATHPDAARALKEFATGIINGQAEARFGFPVRRATHERAIASRDGHGGPRIRHRAAPRARGRDRATVRCRACP
jgi:hypothetical protein